MKKMRNWVPVFGIIALAALFLKLPGISDNLGCRTCASTHLYFTLLGSGYFTILLAVSLLFTSFPGPRLARAGLIWAVLLAPTLIYISFPNWCIACLVAHACNIVIWMIWAWVPSLEKETPGLTLKQKLYFMLLAPIAVVALFSSLNLTFMAYSPKKNPTTYGLQLGNDMPNFTFQTSKGLSISNNEAAQIAGFIINFVTPDCHYSREQLPMIDSVATQPANKSYRFINISPTLPPELVERSPSTDWVEDKDGTLRKLFKVSGYPTLFIAGRNNKITQVIRGVPDQLPASLMISLLKMETAPQ